MRNLLRRLALRVAPLLVALSASGAAAQNIESPYRFVDPGQQLSPFVGYIASDAGAIDLGPESAMAYGLRYGIRLSGPFSVEAAATVFPTSRAIQDTAIVGTDTTTVPTGGEADLLIGLITADLRFDVTGPRTWHRLMPYALLGLGAGLALSDDEDADADVDPDIRYEYGTRLIGELGLGVEWFPTDRLTLRLDARNMLWQIDAPNGLEILAREVPTEEWVQNFLLSAGVAFRF